MFTKFQTDEFLKRLMNAELKVPADRQGLTK